MRKWLFLPILIICGIFQATVLDHLRIFGVKPDLILVGVVAASLSSDLKWALFLSIAAGILKDSLSANTFGINTLLFALWSFLIIKLSRNISLDNNFLRAALVFVVIVTNGIIIRLLYFFLGRFIPPGIFLRTLFLEALYTAAVLPLVFKAIKLLYPL